jgi:AraC-like DNA-binding protein
MNPLTATFYRYFPISQRDKKWGLYATTAGESRIAPHSVYPPHGHPKGFDFDWKHGRVLQEFGLVYISGGRGTFQSGSNTAVRIEAGHVFLFFPGVWHRYTPAADTGWHEHWIGFNGDIARHWLRHKFISAQHPVIKIRAEDTMLATFSRVMESIRGNRPALQQILSGLTALLVGLTYSAQQGEATADLQNANLIELAVARVQNEFARDLDMKQLAQELGVGYSWFRANFAAHTGLSPHQYLLELRIARARSLLAETEFSVKEIALQSGFEDEHYFSRLFRQKLNVTPGQWRDRSRRRR